MTAVIVNLVQDVSGGSLQVWLMGKASYLTCTLCWSILPLDHAWRVVQVRKSLFLLSNLHLLWKQLIRPCVFHAYPHYYPSYQFDFISSSWKNSFQPSSSCLQSVLPDLKTLLLECAFCHKKKIIFCHKLGLFCLWAELVICPVSGLH